MTDHEYLINAYNIHMAKYALESSLSDMDEYEEYFHYMNEYDHQFQRELASFETEMGEMLVTKQQYAAFAKAYGDSYQITRPTLIKKKQLKIIKMYRLNMIMFMEAMQALIDEEFSHGEMLISQEEYAKLLMSSCNEEAIKSRIDKLWNKEYNI